MSTEQPFQEIGTLSLSSFKKTQISGNRGILWRVTWYIVNAIVFNSQFVALLPSGLKATLLRFFGAKIGHGFVCKPRVSIKFPWFMALGNDVWIGEGVWIDNPGMVTIGNNVCLSQGVRLLTGAHNWNVATFPFFSQPITIGEGVWITAFRVIRPGVNIPAHTVVKADLTPAVMRRQPQDTQVRSDCH